MTDAILKPNSGRKLFFGLFIFPLLIAVGMAVLLCSVVLLTHERETPESLIAAIKTGSPSKRWQKAFELSNELNQKDPGLRGQSVVKEMIHILRDSARYDAKTRRYMAIALGRFRDAEAVAALKNSLKDQDSDVVLYSLWALGSIGDASAASNILPFLSVENPQLRKVAAYVLGALGDSQYNASLKKLLNDPVIDVQWNTALALARLGDEGGLPVLLKMLERENLSSHHSMSEIEIEKVMINAIKGLAQIQRPESTAALEAVSKTDKSLKVRQAALDALRNQKESRLR